MIDLYPDCDSNLDALYDFSSEADPANSEVHHTEELPGDSSYTESVQGDRTCHQILHKMAVYPGS